jgi:intracellular sulfur oxidation DsrE/DsrF family protein
MSSSNYASDELKNAFADRELAASERRELQARALQDEQLRHELCEIAAIKGLVRDAYEDSGQARALPAAKRPIAARLVAVALLCVATGWVAHAAFNRVGPNDGAATAPVALASLPSDRVVIPRAANHDRVLLHVSTRDPEDLRSALDAAESMLARTREGTPAAQVEIVANSAGIDLFRSGVSPQAERIAQLHARYPSLRLIACQQSMDRARERGETVVLLPGVDVVPTALDEIIARLHKGWVYVRT